MELEIYDLELRVSHFGRHGRGQESCAATFPSDSFFSALARKRLTTGSGRLSPGRRHIFSRPRFPAPARSGSFRSR